jgi:superfamily II DNA/RNA helicase
MLVFPTCREASCRHALTDTRWTPPQVVVCDQRMESMVSTVVLGADAPVITFEQLGVPNALVSALKNRGITEPLPIQAATIADALAGRDVSAEAPTGSGKTLAFAIPLATSISRGTPKRPAGLVLAPTRELATQIAETLSPLLGTRRLKVQTFFGGAGFGGQRNALRKGVDVAVACPGRLEDLISQGDVSLSGVEMVIIDEADRMADMGFLPAVRRILDAIPSSRQTLLFSATLDGAVDVLVRRYQRDPVRHEVKKDAEDISRVTHHFESVSHADRLTACTDLVSGKGTSIVFVRTKHGVDRLTKKLSQSGVSAAAIHGGRSQAERERALAGFRAGRVSVLVATDVAARGIHVDDVSRVVHYDLPADAKDYIHRSGRTARVGAEGAVISFVTPDQQAKATVLRRDLKLDGGSSSKGSQRRPPARGRGESPSSERTQDGQQRTGRNNSGGFPRGGPDRRSRRRNPRSSSSRDTAR